METCHDGIAHDLRLSHACDRAAGRARRLSDLRHAPGAGKRPLRLAAHMLGKPLHLAAMGAAMVALMAAAMMMMR
jgi:hypothetical protein